MSLTCLQSIRSSAGLLIVDRLSHVPFNLGGNKRDPRNFDYLVNALKKGFRT